MAVTESRRNARPWAVAGLMAVLIAGIVGISMLTAPMPKRLPPYCVNFLPDGLIPSERQYDSVIFLPEIPPQRRHDKSFGGCAGRATESAFAESGRAKTE